MSTTIDFRTMPANVPSLCIPRVFPNIDERRIRGIFDSLNMGEIARVDIICRKSDKGENFNRVFIHWKRWYDSENANKSRERLLNGKEIKIIYNDPWFWKISAYREQQKVSRPVVEGGVPRLQFDSDEDIRREPHQRPQQRPHQRPQQRPKQRDYKIDTPKLFQPTTPNCTPPRPERSEDKVNEQIIHRDSDIDYTGATEPKKLSFKPKKLVVEEGE